MESVAARFILMTLTLIIMGYFLVMIKLFEMLAIIPILCLLAIRSSYRAVHAKQRNKATRSLFVKMYDWLENKYNPWPDIRLWGQQQIRMRWERMLDVLRKPQHVLEMSLLLVIVVISAYIRFYDAVVNAAPAMSDGYVTLAWIKYIDQRVLFHDGIYPQGFHIWMAFVAKFAMIDPLYILKYTGPLNTILLMLGMYLAVSRWSRSNAAGLIALIVYSLFYAYVSEGFYERQVATNSQEFGFVFVIPTLYFLHHWLQNRYRWALVAGIAGMMVVGLVHTLAYLLLGIGVLILLLIYIPLTWRDRFRTLWPILAGGFGSILVALAPIGVGLLLGKSFHSASENYATSRNFTVDFPELGVVDWAAMAAIAILLLGSMMTMRRIREFTAPLLVGLFAAVILAVFYYGTLFSFPGSTVITSRSTELWAMMIPLSIGTACGQLLRPLEKVNWRWRFNTAIVTLLLAASCIAVPPKPIVPYKMEWDSGVEQYLQIRDKHLPKTWTIVSHTGEGYAVVAGSGFQTDVSEFLQKYDPEQYPLVSMDEEGHVGNPTEHIYIYYQKNIYQLSESLSIYTLMEPIYEQRKQEMERLDEWLRQHKQVNPDLSIFYEDENLRIYYIHQPISKQQQVERIWGEGSVAE